MYVGHVPVVKLCANVLKKWSEFLRSIGIAVLGFWIGLLGLVWNVAGYMAGIAMVLEDGGYVAGITVGWRVTGYVAIRVLPLEEGIATGSLAVGVFPLIFESFVG